MRKIYLLDMGLLVVAGTMAAVLADKPLHPAKAPTADIAGKVFDRPEMVEQVESSNATLDVRSPQE